VIPQTVDVESQRVKNAPWLLESGAIQVTRGQKALAEAESRSYRGRS
jgi:hypothetical protein